MARAAQGRHVLAVERYHRDSGIYPATKAGISAFIEVWKRALHAFDRNDMISNSCHQAHQNLVIRKFTNGTKFNPKFTLHGAEPFVWANPWTSALEGKTVLIIHAFVDSIKCQMKRRKTLFKDPTVLPDMELKYVQAVQACCGLTPHASWSKSLQSMIRDIDHVGHVDVAIISAGAFAMPLAAYLKKAKNASAVVLGGAAQLLFGLKGKRWTKQKDPSFRKHYYLDTWMYPLRKDTPKHYKLVENGCYWGQGDEIPDECPV